MSKTKEEIAQEQIDLKLNAAKGFLQEITGNNPNHLERVGFIVDCIVDAAMLRTALAFREAGKEPRDDN